MATPSPEEVIRFRDLPRELRDAVYEYMMMVGERVDLLRAGRIDMRLLWLSGEVRREAMTIYNEEQQYRTTQEFWRDRSFYIEADRAIPGMITLLQNHQNNNYLSWITRLEISATHMRPVFSFYHGIWSCIGPCCTMPLSYQNRHSTSLPHPQRIIILPRGSLFNQAVLRGNLVARTCFVGPHLHSWTNMPNLGHPHNTLLVAELLPGVLEEHGVAEEATGGLWTGLSVWQVSALWGWCRQADASLGPRS